MALAVAAARLGSRLADAGQRDRVAPPGELGVHRAAEVDRSRPDASLDGYRRSPGPERGIELLWNDGEDDDVHRVTMQHGSHTLHASIQEEAIVSASAPAMDVRAGGPPEAEIAATEVAIVA